MRHDIEELAAAWYAARDRIECDPSCEGVDGDGCECGASDTVDRMDAVVKKLEEETRPT